MCLLVIWFSFSALNREDLSFSFLAILGYQDQCSFLTEMTFSVIAFIRFKGLRSKRKYHVGESKAVFTVQESASSILTDMLTYAGI